MVIRKRPELDMENPPGQIRYLRDVIKKYQEDEKPQEAPLVKYATQVPTAAEKRLQALERALLRLCDGADKRLRNGEPPGWWSTEIRKILQENS